MFVKEQSYNNLSDLILKREASTLTAISLVFFFLCLKVKVFLFSKIIKIYTYLWGHQKIFFLTLSIMLLKTGIFSLQWILKFSSTMFFSILFNFEQWLNDKWLEFLELLSFNSNVCRSKLKKNCTANFKRSL